MSLFKVRLMMTLLPPGRPSVVDVTGDNEKNGPREHNSQEDTNDNA
jgi:hypothetical protein